MRGKSRHIAIIDYDPDDYSLASSLLHDSSLELDNLSEISSLFSLFFQWPEHRQCHLKKQTDSKWLKCGLSHDTDDRRPRELFVSISEKHEFNLVAAERLIFRIEIFGRCYEFSTEMIADLKSDATFIISIPQSVSMLKPQDGACINVTSKAQKEIGDIYWQSSSNDTKSLICQISQISPKSLSGLFSSEIVEGPGRVRIGDHSFGGKLIKHGGETGTIALRFNSGIESGHFFDFYRRAAYPNLRWKYEIDENNLLLLYQLYLDDFFPAEKHLEIRSEMIGTWRETKEGTHTSIADYVTINDANEIVGASSAALAFFKKGREQWAFHQFCTLTDESNLDLTQDLYTWRSDYLLAKPEDLDVVFWYISKSRWLERIYTKFMTLTHLESELHPVEIREIYCSKEIVNHQDCDLHTIGKAQRAYFETEHLLGGFLPRRLSIGNVLDHFLPADFSASPEKFEAALKQILDDMTQERTTVYVTSYPGQKLDVEVVGSAPPDRFARIPKEGLADFRASVEHSIAVTKRKLSKS